MLKDHGIGHPPLYHLLQKFIQTIFTNYHPMQVRLVNYIVGTLFILLLVRILSKEKDVPFFYYGLSSAAGILNVFVFSRMWGLVCLFSLLLLWRGEKYVENPDRKNVLLFLCVFFFGIFSDYNFILMIPYVLLVLSNRTRYINPLTLVLQIVFLAAWIFAMYRFSLPNSLNMYSLAYRLIESSCKVFYEMGFALFNFWFHEPFMIALGAAVFCYYWFDIRGKANIAEGKHAPDVLFLVTCFVVILISLEILIRNDIIRIRQVMLPLVLTSIMMAWSAKNNGLVRMGSGSMRLVTSIFCAVLILLSVHSMHMFLTRDLREARFLDILMPLILLLFYRSCSRKTVVSVSLVFFISGLLFVTSNGISDHYPPPHVVPGLPAIFQDEFAYSTQYFYEAPSSSESPFIMVSKFDKSCRVCKMGITDIPLLHFARFRLVTRNGFDPGNFLQDRFRPCSDRRPNLTYLDRLQFRYFTPIHPVHYVVSEYCRTSSTYTTPKLHNG